MWYKNIKSGRKTANINTKKTLEILSLLRPIVHDTSKTAKITWFILVLHWAKDVIYDFYYIHGPMEYYRINQVIFAVLDVSWTLGLNSDKTSKAFFVLIRPIIADIIVTRLLISAIVLQLLISTIQIADINNSNC